MIGYCRKEDGKTRIYHCPRVIIIFSLALNSSDVLAIGQWHIANSGILLLIQGMCLRACERVPKTEREQFIVRVNFGLKNAPVFDMAAPNIY